VVETSQGKPCDFETVISAFEYADANVADAMVSIHLPRP
jgi:hypothetical protein